MSRLCYSFLLLLALCGCAGTKNTTTPVIEERIYHDTIKTIQHQRDSIYLHDSIYLSRVGDTVYLEKWHTVYSERTKWRDSIKVVRDSIPVEVRTTVEKEVRYIPWYAKFLSIVGLITLAVGAFWVFTKFIKK